jgi:hypothetical protein
MDNKDEAYAKWMADIIISYFADQLTAGRDIIYESEVWEMLGLNFPEDMEDRKFILKEYNDNVISLSEYRTRH